MADIRPVNMCRKIPSASSPLAVTVLIRLLEIWRAEYPHAWDQQASEMDRIDAAPLVNERFRLEHRMMLRGTVFHEGKPVFQDIALNEMIATSAEHLRVLRYDLAVNDEYLNEAQRME